MDKGRLTSLLERFLNGSCTREEETELIRYISENDNEDIRSLLDSIWTHPTHTLSKARGEKVLERILGNRKPAISGGFNPVWMKIAASVTLVAVFAVGVYRYYAGETPKPARDVTANDAPHQFIKLADGSTVILNAHSTLDYPDSFSGKDTREVTLSGEAFFNISHDADRPFIVHTGQLNTTVLGTSFNVRAYADQDDITVTVTRGKVRVSDDRNILGIITPDQQITFSRKSKKSLQQAVNAPEVTSWADRDIYFEDVSMSDAVDQLEDRFDVTIEFENEGAKDCRFTATFVNGEDLVQILDVICAFNNAKFAQDAAGNIMIYGEGCDPSKL